LHFVIADLTDPKALPQELNVYSTASISPSPINTSSSIDKEYGIGMGLYGV
jgi:hypothetical protein